MYSFTSLRAEYATLWSKCVVDPFTMERARARVEIILPRANKEDWGAVQTGTGVPKGWAIASFERESSSDYGTSPAQGDDWHKVSVHVPAGLGPYHSWTEAAIAAYRIDHLNRVGDWSSFERWLYEGEAFNGFGPREHGIHTGYLWAGTSLYVRGKYPADGEWSATTVDKQMGMIPILVALFEADPTLAPAGLVLPRASDPLATAEELPAPIRTVTGEDDVRWLQGTLNRLGATPALLVDGSYGRATRRAVAAFQTSHGLDPDGIAGPLMLNALRGLA